MTGITISYCFKVMPVAKTNTNDQNIRITSLSSVILPSGPGMNGGLYSGIGNTYPCPGIRENALPSNMHCTVCSIMI